MNIDWSKAPEGATHYYLRGDTPWRDLSGENWKWFSNGKWYSDNSVSSWVDRSSQGFLERRCAELIPRPAANQEKQARRDITLMQVDLGRKGVHLSYHACEVIRALGYRKFEIVEEDV